MLGNDAFNDPGNGFFSLRVANAAAGSGAVDIYLTAPGADITSSAPTLTNISYGVTSAFAPIAIGASFEIRVTTTGTKDVLFDSTPKTFAEHSANDLVVFGKGSGKLVNVALLVHDSAGTGALVDNLLAQYKVINASLVPSALNIFLDGTLQLSNIPYRGVSNYQKTSAGAHSFRNRSDLDSGRCAVDPVADALAGDRHIDRAGRNRWSADGAGAERQQPSATERDRRCADRESASAGGAAFDVFVNFSKQVSGLAVNSASPYLNFNAAANTGTGYEFDFNVAGTTTAVLTLTGVVLTSGHKYTIYIAGPNTALQGIVTQDL